MEFDLYSCESSLSSDDQNTLAWQMNKTKQLPTKFFTQLNKHQKIVNRKKSNQRDSNSSKFSISKKKIHKRSPTFKQMLMTSKKYLAQQLQEIDKNIQNQNKKLTESKKKVRFNRQNQTKLKERKPSIQKMTPFNFCDSIKQMAFELTQSKKQCVNGTSHQENQNQQNLNEDSLFSGYTEKQFQDGTRFKGICQKGVIIKGQLHFSNGYIYDGQLFLDKFHGKGKLTLPKKQVIEGDWVEGEIVGKATIKYPKGQIYYGDLKQFRRHGKGHLFFTDGSKYEGQFNNGQLTGYGVHIATSGQKTGGYWFYGDFIGANEQVFDNVMANVVAHQKKRVEKQTQKLRISKRNSMRNSMKISKTVSMRGYNDKNQSIELNIQTQKQNRDEQILQRVQRQIQKARQTQVNAKSSHDETRDTSGFKNKNSNPLSLLLFNLGSGN